MIHKNAALGVFLLSVTSLTGLHAQQTLTADGGNASGGGGSASYTLGQVVYTTNTGTNGSVLHGIQVPFEISVITSMDEAIGGNLIATVYPNPAVSELILKVDNYGNRKLSYQLYNSEGKLLENKNLTGRETSIQFGDYPPAAYLLKLTGTGNEIKVFKILKNQNP